MNRQEFFQSVLPVHEEAGNSTVSSPSNAASGGPGAPFILRRENSATSGLEPYTGAWNTTTAAHLLRRTMFGPRRAEIQAVAAGSMNTAVNTILSVQSDPNPPTGPAGENFTALVYDSNNDGTYRNYLKAWWIGLMVKQPISIVEKMTLFWHNHFVSESNDIQDVRYSYFQNVLFRQNALGNFKSLVKAVTIDPAMLRYLNGNTNTKARANENYGRELQELITIGKGPEISQGNYTNYAEQDVQAAAKVLTGWTDVRGDATNPTPRSSFNANNHDTTDKTFSSAYQNTVIRSTLVNGLADGSKEIDDLLNMIFAQQATSLYICRKLYRWFVYYDISADVEANVIVPMAAILRSNNFAVKPVLDTLFKSAHFYDPNTMGCFIRTPIDIVVGSVRQLPFSPIIPDLSLSANYSLANSLRNTAANLGMNLFDPPDVAGWKAYYQIPDYHELWINATTLPTRGQYTDSLFTAVRNGTTTYKVDPFAYAQTMNAPDNPYTLIDDLARELFALTLTQKQKDYLMYSVMLLHQGSEYEWTTNWQAYLANPNNTTAKNYVTNTLNNLLKFMLRMAEAQLA
jgi:uncharacterized protein (DUF1800 family)